MIKLLTYIEEDPMNKNAVSHLGNQDHSEDFASELKERGAFCEKVCKTIFIKKDELKDKVTEIGNDKYISKLSPWRTITAALILLATIGALIVSIPYIWGSTITDFSDHFNRIDTHLTKIDQRLDRQDSLFIMVKENHEVLVSLFKRDFH
jgi:hypothetical protein